MSDTIEKNLLESHDGVKDDAGENKTCMSLSPDSTGLSFDEIAEVLDDQDGLDPELRVCGDSESMKALDEAIQEKKARKERDEEEVE